MAFEAQVNVENPKTELKKSNKMTNNVEKVL